MIKNRIRIFVILAFLAVFALAPLIATAYLLRGMYYIWMPYRPAIAEIIGNYRSNTSPASWYLVLRKNGTYQETFHPSAGLTITNSGKWKLSNQQYGCSVTLDNAIVDDDHSSMGSNEKSDWSLDTGRSDSGRTTLVIEEDEGLYLTRLD